MRVWPSLFCPARPGTFLITIQSLSVYTIAGAEWTIAEGSPWEALEAPPCLAFHRPLPSDRNVSPAAPPQARAHTQTHVGSFPPPTHTSRESVGDCYFSLLLIFGRYWSLLWLERSAIGAPLTVLMMESLRMGHVSSCRSVKALALKTSCVKAMGHIWRDPLIHKAKR